MNNASMFAQAGQNIGQSIGGGISSLGKGVGGLLQGRADRKVAEEQAETVQKELKQYANDPAQLNSLGQKAQSRGDDRTAKMFFEAAKQAVDKEAKNATRGVQGGLAAITQAASRGVPLAELQDATRSVLAQNGTQADIMQAYKNGLDLSKGEERKTVSLSAGGALVDANTGEVLHSQPFKPESAPASKGITTVERDDGSVSVLDKDTGDLISTLPATGAGGEAKRDASLNLIAQTTSFIQDVDALMDPGFFESGIPGALLSNVPGRAAYDREKELLSIRARLGFEQINEMKRLAAESGASGTGLGQISNIEFMSLQSTIDAIYTGMSGEAQNEALESIKRHLLNVQKLASGVAPADAIEWDKPEYKAVGYHKDAETGTVFYAPDGPNGTVYKLVDGEFKKLGAYLGSTTVE